MNCEWKLDHTLVPWVAMWYWVIQKAPPYRKFQVTPISNCKSLISLLIFREDVCVLSATGTAAIINLQFTGDMSYLDVSSKTQLSTNSKELMTSSLDRQEFENEGRSDGKVSIATKPSESSAAKNTDEEGESENSNGKNAKDIIVATTPPTHQPPTGCSICHIPYSQATVPYRVTMMKCALCK